MSPAAQLFFDLSECMSDCAKKAGDSNEYEGHADEAAALKVLGHKVQDMDEDTATSFLLTVEPVERREALLRLGVQTGILVFKSKAEDDD